MNAEIAIQRAQAYAFFADVFLYPKENWTDSLRAIQLILENIEVEHAGFDAHEQSLEELQSSYLKTFGVTGSLCYETEYGHANEFSQSQEMADISGFYRAFGFQLGGQVHERPDHIAVELEFMHVLTLKEAYAKNQGMDEQAEICLNAQRNFMQDHLGKWFDVLAKSVGKKDDGLYANISQTASAFIKADIRRLKINFSPLSFKSIQPTPFDPNFSCDDCAVTDNLIMPSGITHD